MADHMPNGLFVAAASLRMSPLTLASLDVDWAHFAGSEAATNELRAHIVATMAEYPQSTRDEILSTTWGREMARAREAAAPAAGGILVEEESADEVEVEEAMEPVATTTVTNQEAARPIVGNDTTPNLLANTSINEEDEEDEEVESAWTNFEGQQLLASDQSLLVAEEWSPDMYLRRQKKH